MQPSGHLERALLNWEPSVGVAVGEVVLYMGSSRELPFHGMQREVAGTCRAMKLLNAEQLVHPTVCVVLFRRCIDCLEFSEKKQWWARRRWYPIGGVVYWERCRCLLLFEFFQSSLE